MTEALLLLAVVGFLVGLLYRKRKPPERKTLDFDTEYL